MSLKRTNTWEAKSNGGRLKRGRASGREIALLLCSGRDPRRRNGKGSWVSLVPRENIVKFTSLSWRRISKNRRPGKIEPDETIAPASLGIFLFFLFFFLFFFFFLFLERSPSIYLSLSLHRHLELDATGLRLHRRSLYGDLDSEKHVAERNAAHPLALVPLDALDYSWRLLLNLRWDEYVFILFEMGKRMRGMRRFETATLQKFIVWKVRNFMKHAMYKRLAIGNFIFYFLQAITCWLVWRI